MKTLTSPLTNLKRALRRRTRRKSWPAAYAIDQQPGKVSEAALSAAKCLRGDDRKPGIIIFGVMPRSGTVMVGEILRLHPELAAYPNNIWEIPFLQQLPHLQAFQRDFFRDYQQNSERMAEDDLLAIFGAAFIGYLHNFAPAEKRILLKEAGVGFLRYLPSVFPGENVLLLMRDGRDLVHSTLRTWPSADFGHVANQWALSTSTLLAHHTAHETTGGIWKVNYEDVLDDQLAFIRQACVQFDLNPEQFPYEEIADVRVIGSSTIAESGKVDWSQHKEKPKDFKPSQHWQQWSNQQKDQFKRIAGQALIDAGYVKDNNW